MGVRDWIRRKLGPSFAPSTPAGPSDAAPGESDPRPQLARAGAPDGPSVGDALAALRAARGTALEQLALRRLLAFPGELPEPLRIAAALMLAERGERESAERLLREAASARALVVRADLRAERGDWSAALGLVERALLEDIALPGAWERRERWRDELGLRAAARRTPSTDPTLFFPAPPSPYVILREAGRGGTAAVYEAWDRELTRPVALKVYHAPGRDRALLAHEARTAATLAGPGIVAVYDTDPGDGWISLRWAPRGCVRAVLRSSALHPLAAVESWAAPLASALGRVHAAGWVHNDVKPTNVLLGDDGSPILTDFALAARAGEPSRTGSAGYMSPERAAGRRSHPRDDIFAFGRLLDEVLSALGEGARTSRWRPIAAACVGPDEARPADGAALAMLFGPGHPAR